MNVSPPVSVHSRGRSRAIDAEGTYSGHYHRDDRDDFQPVIIGGV
ncbi:hypothetical protein HSR122_1504 [Halapricum desulfuricans]|uniref:Uncharacterized protein n=1 Tax=Halapricum desulfuricans TaxID=2841257 RepID=A0A897NEU6_9EURY|nr:hypothetical protein HSR122_1504 [Halapricum desulfuricans]